MSKLSNAVKWFQHTDMKGCDFQDICTEAKGFYAGFCYRGMWLINSKWFKEGDYLPSRILQYNPYAVDGGLTIKGWPHKVVYPNAYDYCMDILRKVSKQGIYNGPVMVDPEQVKWIKKQDKEAFIEIQNTGVFTGIAEFSRAVDILTYKNKNDFYIAFYVDYVVLFTYDHLVALHQYKPERMKEYRKRIYKLNLYNVNNQRKKVK